MPVSLTYTVFADGDLLFQQVPMVEIDGMKLVQTKAIFNYIAEKAGLNGKDPKERVMYAQIAIKHIDGTVTSLTIILSSGSTCTQRD